MSRVLKAEITGKGDLIITVESTLEGTQCRSCGRDIRDFHGYDKPLRLVTRRSWSAGVYRNPAQALPLSSLSGGSDDDARCGW